MPGLIDTHLHFYDFIVVREALLQSCGGRVKMG